MDTLITYHCNIDSIRDYLNLYFFLIKNTNSTACFKIIIKGKRKRKLIESKNFIYIHVNILENYDIGGYSLAINHSQIENYDYFMFINSSTLGPIEYIEGEWINKYKSLLSEDVCIAGSSIFVMEKNVFESNKLSIYFNYPYSTVQTYAFILNKVSINMLSKEGFFNLITQSKNDLILNFEIGISQYLIYHNYNLACLLDGYNYDYREKNLNPNSSSRNGDPIYKNAYFGSTINPYDVIFIKTNRKVLNLISKFALINNQLNKISNQTTKYEYKAIINIMLFFEIFYVTYQSIKKFYKTIFLNIKKLI